MSRLVLGIETSCDDTGAAVLDETGHILGESLHSQKDVHLRWVSEPCYIRVIALRLLLFSHLPPCVDAAGPVASSPQWHSSFTGKT